MSFHKTKYFIFLTAFLIAGTAVVFALDEKESQNLPVKQSNGFEPDGESVSSDEEWLAAGVNKVLTDLLGDIKATRERQEKDNAPLSVEADTLFSHFQAAKIVEAYQKGQDEVRRETN